MKGLGLFVVAALFSATAVAQVNTEERDLQNRKAPVKTETEIKTKEKTKTDADIRKDADLKKSESKDMDVRKSESDMNKTKSKSVKKSETDLSKSEVDHKDLGGRVESESAAGLKEDNTICCGDEKDDGFLGIWKFNVDNKEKDNSDKHQNMNAATETKTKTKVKSETETGAATLEDQNAVSTESDVNIYDDTRMDAGGRTESLDLNESEMDMESHDSHMLKSDEMKDTGSRCPAVNSDENTIRETDDSRMQNDNSPKF